MPPSCGGALRQRHVERELTVELARCAHEAVVARRAHAIQSGSGDRGAIGGSEHRLQRLDEPAEVVGADHVSVGAHVAGECAIGFFQVAVREQNDGHACEGLVVANVGAELEAVDVRHQDVAHDDVRRRLARDLERCTAVAGLEDLEAEAREMEHAELALQWVVVGEQEPAPGSERVGRCDARGQVRLHGGTQARRIDGLVHDVVEAGRPDAPLVDARDEPRHGDDRDGRAERRANRLHEIEPVSIGQHEVEQHEIGSARLGRRERGAGTACLDDVDLLGAQDGPDEPPRHRAVVDDEHGGPAHERLPAEASVTTRSPSARVSMGLDTKSEHPAS